MQRKLFVFAGIVLLCLIGYGLYLYNKPHTGIANIEPSESLTAAALYNEYAGDEKAGDAKFLNKIIEITGVVDNVEKTDSTINIFLKGNEMNGVNCSVSLKDNDKNISLKKDQPIKLKGRCTGFIMDVELIDCIIEK